MVYKNVANIDVQNDLKLTYEHLYFQIFSHGRANMSFHE